MTVLRITTASRRFCVVGRRRFSQIHEQNVRVRFAPSPTGQLHLGGLRTALYNYLFAKLHNGNFILRIEDTDQTRVVPGADEKLVDMLQWAGIQIHEGPMQGGDYGPYVQSQRRLLYTEMTGKLLENGSAYRCFCTEKRLKLMRKSMIQRGEVPQYDNRCRSLTEQEVAEHLQNGRPYTVRLKLETYEDAWHDMIYGPIKHDIAASECDPIIMKSDGYPTYHLANVVDDHHMKITHVLRGMEWQTSTTKHLLLYRAFGWTPPKFAHMPVLINQDGKKLSKRQNDMHVEHFKKEGYDPGVLINWLCHMSSGFTRDRTEMHGLSMDQLAQSFAVDRINTHPARLDFDLLQQFRQEHLISQYQNDKASLIAETRRVITEHFINRENMEVDLSDELIGNILDKNVISRRISSLKDLVSAEFDFLWRNNIQINQTELQALSKNSSEILDCVITTLESMELKEMEKFGEYLRKIAKDKKFKYSEVMKLTRLALYGKMQGPPVPELLVLLGKDICTKRLQYLNDLIKDSQNIEHSQEAHS